MLAHEHPRETPPSKETRSNPLREQLAPPSFERFAAAFHETLRRYTATVPVGARPGWKMLYSYLTTGILAENDPDDEQNPLQTRAKECVAEEGMIHLEQIKHLLQTNLDRFLQEPVPPAMRGLLAQLTGNPPTIEHLISGKMAKHGAKIAQELGALGSYLPFYAQNGFSGEDGTDFIVFRTPASYQQKNSTEQVPHSRIYLNPKLANLAEVAAACVLVIQKENLPVEIKFFTQNPASHDEEIPVSPHLARTERIVVYAPTSEAGRVTKLLEPVIAAHASAFEGQAISPLLSPIHEGVGAADDPTPHGKQEARKALQLKPTEQVSFHMARAAFVGEVAKNAAKELFERDPQRFSDLLPSIPTSTSTHAVHPTERIWPHILARVSSAEAQAALAHAKDTQSSSWDIDPVATAWNAPSSSS